ncbi:hypothetical protein EPD60_14445 [Flaviaesturariibacter flavus]|uniref:Peptidase n=1 Tax=Flaviaesturariibacter flavus TaxID=2502780 RepID=A0A4R1B320_9BACT|nr:M12 family metallo-peptidase [Flaviaesturariibacter flavus]TCJ12472.1 hypothetical protein EPD60_14445 [Flaviaesturariibacter flavus]
MKYSFPLLLLVLLLGACKKDSKQSRTNIDERSTGQAAGELLAADPYSALRVEISYMPGYAPDNAAVAQLINFLGDRLNKPLGISAQNQAIGASGRTSLAAADLAAIERGARTLHSDGNTATIHILYTDGNYTDNNVLGVAYGGTSVALFGKKIHDNSGGIGQASRTKLEATVLEHEIGHLLGLVDIGTPMRTAHKDPNGTAHCNNSNCLMYYAAETTDVLGFLISGPVPPLDAACLQDLQGNGGR